MQRTSVTRDGGLRRLRHATTAAALVCGGLAVGVAGLAAKALPGRSAKRQTAVTRATTATTTARKAEAPPPLVSAGAAASPTPSAPASPPAPTPAPPVVSSGGS